MPLFQRKTGRHSRNELCRILSACTALASRLAACRRKERCAPLRSGCNALSAQRRYARRNSVKRLTAVVKLCCLSRLPCNAGTFRHRCGARSSKPAAGFTVCGRFDSYTSPPISDPRCFRQTEIQNPLDAQSFNGVLRPVPLMRS